MAHLVSVSLHVSGTDSHTESESHHTYVLLNKYSWGLPESHICSPGSTVLSEVPQAFRHRGCALFS